MIEVLPAQRWVRGDRSTVLRVLVNTDGRGTPGELYRAADKGPPRSGASRGTARLLGADCDLLVLRACAARRRAGKKAFEQALGPRALRGSLWLLRPRTLSGGAQMARAVLGVRHVWGCGSTCAREGPAPVGL